MEKKRTNTSAVLCVLAAGCLWGCMGILVRTMNKGGFTSLEVTAFRSVITCFLMLVGLGIFDRKALRIRWKDVWCFLGTGILSVVFFNVCYFSCMNYTALSTAAILLYTAPAFVMVLSAILFRERITGRKLLALGIAFLGCTLVSGGLGGGISPMGLLTGLGAGFGYALYSIFSRFAIQRGYSSYTITVYTFLFAFAGTLPFLDIGHTLGCIRGTPQILLPGVVLAFFTTVVAYLFYTKGLSGMENGRASIIASIEPVVAALVGFFLYQEKMTPMGMVGMALVLAACALMQ